MSTDVHATHVHGIDQFLDDHAEDHLRELLNLSRIPGVASAPDRGPLERTAQAIATKFERMGFAVRIDPTDGGPPVVIASAGPEDSPRHLICYGHYDVFPVDGQEGWNTEPFEPVVEGDRLYGRGVADNKGQFLAHMNALDWWGQQPGGLPIRVTMILEGEEEVGSPHFPAWIQEHSAELQGDLCVYSDGPTLAGDAPAVLFGARGALCLEFTANGLKRPLHSGGFGGTVRNPALRLARLFSDIVAPNGDILVPGVEHGVPQPTTEELNELSALPFDVGGFEEQTGQTPLPWEHGENFYVRQLLKPSFNVSGFASGDAENFKTLVPDTAKARVDIRLVGEQDPAHVLSCLREFIADRGYEEISVRELFNQPPSRTPFDARWATTVMEAMRFGFARSDISRVPSLPGTTPDWVFTKLLDLPTYMLPLGPVDENHHGPNETMRLSLMRAGTRTMAELVRLLARS